MKRSEQIKASELILTLHTFYWSQSTLSIDGNDSVEHVVDWDEVEQLAWNKRKRSVIDPH